MGYSNVLVAFCIVRIACVSPGVVFVSQLKKDYPFKCFDFQFQCKISGKCIQRDQVRNGFFNCGLNDTSDEDEILTCNPSEYQCRVNGQCWKRKEINRHIGVCSDQSDAGGIQDFPCREGEEFRCPDKGRCIPRHYVNTMFPECPASFADEESTLICNEKTEFLCPDTKRCIPRSWVNDGKVDCMLTGIDEQITLNKCNKKTGEYMCPGNKRRCIPRYMVGDGVRDCKENGADEKLGKFSRCRENEFACKISFVNTTMISRCIPLSWVNDGVVHCLDASDEQGQLLKCRNGEYSCDNGTRCIERDKVCDGVLDCADCSDETNADLCHKWTRDKYFTCEKPIGLGNSLNENGIVSSHCVLRSYFCDGKIDCADGSDEASSGPGMKCKVTKMSLKDKFLVTNTCILPGSMLNDGIVDCDDALDEVYNDTIFDIRHVNCLSTTALMKDWFANHTMFNTDAIFYRQLCDGIFDCHDLSDECLCGETDYSDRTLHKSSVQVCDKICYKNNYADSKVCQLCPAGALQCATKNSSFCVNASSICDGIIDCLNGDDERFCAKERVIATDPKKHKNQTHRLVKCPHEYLTKRYPEIPEYGYLYDGVPECFTLADECEDPEVFGIDDVELLPDKPAYCALAGFDSRCIRDIPIYPSQICNGVIECENGKDEEYCNDVIFKCDVITESESDSDSYHGKTVGIFMEQVCDKLVDCKDGRDELNCPEHFYCGDKSSPLFIEKFRVLDGTRDCLDGSDECPNPQVFKYDPLSSKNQLIENPFIRVWLFCITILSLLGNLIVLVTTSKQILSNQFAFVECFRRRNRRNRRRSSSHIAQTRSRLATCNNILIFNLALSDLMSSLYLFSLSMKTIEYSGSYCDHHVIWRTSFGCNLIGTIILISLFASVAITLVLTSYRLFAVVFPWRVSSLQSRTTVAISIIIWVTAFIMGFIPSIGSLGDVFVDSINIPHNNVSQLHALFSHQVITKDQITQFIVRSCGLIAHMESPHTQWDGQALTILDGICGSLDNPSLTWQNIEEGIRLLTHQELTIKYLGYFSDHGVCLPSLFSNGKNSKKSYFTTFIVTYNLLSCVYIICAYCVVCVKAKKKPLNPTSYVSESKTLSAAGNSAHNTMVTSLRATTTVILLKRALTKSDSPARSNDRGCSNKRLNDMQKRIARIIFTNFICWVPVCVFSCIRLSGTNLPEWIYSFSAVVLLPINSALNPMLYSDTHLHVMRKVKDKFKRMFSACR